MQNRPIRFFHRGRIVEIADAPPTRSVLDWLREDARCSGTKEGCNEGDCGACTVLIGERVTDERPGDVVVGAPDGRSRLRLRSLNACLQFVPALDGKALFSVEDVAQVGDRATDPLHPVQRAMVDCHGSQCGFCTPGFVVSLWLAYERHRAAGTRPTRQQLADELAGNLCRCTGYRPILDAGLAMFDLPEAVLDVGPVLAALDSLASGEGFDYEARGARFAVPRTLAELAGVRVERPAARIVAGSTDVALWVNKLFRPLPDLVGVADVTALQAIESDDEMLRIGAGASLEHAFRALVARWPTLQDLWLRFAAPPIRHAGTIGGNLANGSPIGDCAPVLMALGAELVLRRGDAQRRIALDAFYVDYMKNRLDPGEFIERVDVPLASAAAVRAYKISKRFDCDISAVCAGLAIELDAGSVKSARFAFGGMAATVRRASEAEAAVLGQPWTEATLFAAQAALACDFVPLTDMRASADYRMQVAQNLLRRFWLETRPEAPLAAHAVSVWPVLPHAAPARGAAA
ncbi:xanthine dehydrogenase small subunit [Piscinibacter koreensis]|uniref:Xanthine dehydrogenase small subunit n=1 Tax=Piscinibacter koreensis TaxID=2742824 RepID=A0A7Y6NPD1_9BURK|nr:xanthine dehydrogenase small subunit [Schlegelella koreensis]NUZ06897.1 xanthine dehydrogenase small subunit [Schlegelella koreensis]